MKLTRASLITMCALLSLSIPKGSIGAPASSLIDRVQAEEIQLIGVTVFKPSEIEKVIEVSVGTRIEHAKIAQTAKNIQELYRSAGYEAVKIETRLVTRSKESTGKAEHVLEIEVLEGKPTRVAEVVVSYDLPGWENRLKATSGKIGLNPGDLYAREKLLNGYRAMQDGLTAWDFLSPKIEETAVEQVAPPQTPETAPLVGTTARWVRIRVKVLLGDRISFAYRDNSVFPNSQLASWVEEQRLLGFSQDYIERIRSRFEDEYRKIGYDRIKIDVYTFEDRVSQRRRVTYVFLEGPRVEIERIDFDGNTVFSSSVLREQFYERASPLVSRNYYVSKDIDQSAEVLVEWLKSQGYLAAKLVSISRNIRPRDGRVELMIYLYEGEQTVVDTIRFEDLTVFSAAELMALLGNEPGKPLNLYRVNEGLEKVKARYREYGYLDIKIGNEATNRLVLYSQENRVAEIVLELKEGVQYRVSRIEIEGLQKTRPEIVQRELELREGDVLSERDWYRSEARLRRLGVFSSASIKAFPDPAQKDRKILKVLLEEGSPGLLAASLGLRNDLGGRAFGQIQYSNLWGRNHTLAFTATANRRFKNFGSDFCPSIAERASNPNIDHCFIEFNGTVGYVWPWFSLGETTFRPRFSFERTQYINFDADTSSFQASWERALVRSWGLTGALTYSLEQIQQYHANIATDNRQLRIGSISPTIILDRRNNALAPTKGTYTTFQYDLARSVFGSQDSPPENPPIAYWRAQFRNDMYVPLPKGLDLFVSFRTGLEYNLATPPPGASDSTYAIPLIKQFTLGGVGSLRGFAEQSLNVQNKDIRGSLTYVNYRTQLDIPFAGAMKFGPFFDAANLNTDNYSLGSSHSPLRVGVGVGFHYKSPVGPVNFDIGVNPSPLIGEDNYKLHFSIGNI